MGYLSPPRLYFQGTFRADAATGNNYQKQRFCGTVPIDESCQEEVEVFDVANARVNILKASDGRLLTDDEMLQVLQANQPKMWNYQGANTINFDATTITGVDLGHGLSRDDRLVGASVLLNRAAMVDINPAGILNTQIFSDDFVVQLDDTLSLRGVPTRSFSRWIWFQRNPAFKPFYPPTGQASGVFQAALPLSTLSFKGTGSPAFAALQAAASGAGLAGLSVRFCLYAMRTQQQGQRNPGLGVVSGVIGLQRADEMSSYPVSRRLQPTAATDGALGPAFAHADVPGRTLTLDLVTTVPEDTVDLQKKNLGPLHVRVRNGSTVLDIGTLAPTAYDRQAYEATSGLVVLSYAQKPKAKQIDDLLPNGVLEVMAPEQGMTILQEAPLNAETDDASTYIQQGETRQLNVRVFDRARPAASTLAVQEFITTYTGDPPAHPNPPAEWIVDAPSTVTVDASGRATVPITGKEPGVCAIRFTVPGTDVNGPYDRLHNTLALVRVLPRDDYDYVTDAELAGEAGFKLVYREVFQYYYILYPVMRPIVDFSHYEYMRRSAGYIKAAIAKENWGKYSYMPRTRELSDGKRKLIDRWCDVVLADS